MHRTMASVVALPLLALALSAGPVAAADALLHPEYRKGWTL